jgi:hypothetical protein
MVYAERYHVRRAGDDRLHRRGHRCGRHEHVRRLVRGPAYRPAPDPVLESVLLEHHRIGEIADERRLDPARKHARPADQRGRVARHPGQRERLPQDAAEQFEATPATQGMQT